MSNTVDAWYGGLIRDVVDFGEIIQTRNSRVRRLFARQFCFNKTPLVSVRKTAWKNALREWEWFMSGSNRISDLHPSVRPWWEPWATPAGEVPLNYSVQFRSAAGQDEYRRVDQIQLLIDGVRDHPHSRRNVISTWNTADMTDPACPITNCHSTVVQAFVDDKNVLSLVTYQRSVDVVCGLPHNWIQSWAFLLWLANRTGRKPGNLVWIGGDIHVYDAHADLAREIIAKRFENPPGPELLYGPTSDSFRADDFSLSDEYSPLITTRAEMIL